MPAQRPPRRSQSVPLIETLEIRRLLSADLTGFFAGKLPADLQAGDRNHLAVRVVNEGDAAVGKVTVDLYASDPGAGNDVLLASVTRNMNLKPDRGSSVSFRFAQPASLPDGHYSLLASVTGNTSSDANTTNDIFVAPLPVTVHQPSADLTSGMVMAPPQAIVISGDTIIGQPASARVQNRGNAPADGEVSVSFYLSPDRTLDSQDVLAGTATDFGVNLKPGHGETFRAELEPPPGTPSGNYFLFAAATPGQGIVRTNTADEVAVAPKLVAVNNVTPIGYIDRTPTTQTDQSVSPISVNLGTTSPVCVTPTTGSSPDCPPSNACSTPTCDDESQTSDAGDQSCDSGNQTSDNGDPSCDTGDQPCDTGQPPSTDDGSQDDSTTDQGQPADNTQPADPSQQDQPQPADDSGPSTDNPAPSDASGDSSTSTDASPSDPSQQDDTSQSTNDSSTTVDGSQDNTSPDTSGQTSDPSPTDSGGDSWIDPNADGG